MGKLFKLGLGRSKTGKILDRDTKWFETEQGVLKHVSEHPEDASKPLFISINGGAYEKYSLEECSKAIERINRN